MYLLGSTSSQKEARRKIGRTEEGRRRSVIEDCNRRSGEELRRKKMGSLKQNEKKN